MSQAVYSKVTAGDYDQSIRPFLDANVKLRINGEEIIPTSIKQLRQLAREDSEKTLILDGIEIPVKTISPKK